MFNRRKISSCSFLPSLSRNNVSYFICIKIYLLSQNVNRIMDRIKISSYSSGMGTGEKNQKNLYESWKEFVFVCVCFYKFSMLNCLLSIIHGVFLGRSMLIFEYIIMCFVVFSKKNLLINAFSCIQTSVQFIRSLCVLIHPSRQPSSQPA